MNVKILGTGAYAPEKILTNEYFAGITETSDEWIVTRTGIRERRASRLDQPTSDLAVEAARRALEAAGTKPEEVDAILVATCSPDHLIPPTAAHVQQKLGCWNASASDLSAACSGFTYGLAQGRALVAVGDSKRCLVIGAEELSKFTDYKDRTTCILFGDGAGAVVLGPSDDDSAILYSKLGCDGRLNDLIVIPAGGTALLPDGTVPGPELRHIKMKGREVYKFAVPKFVEIINEALRETGLRAEDIRAFIPHQMNARMIEAMAQRLSLPMERVVVNIERFGNTSAASIPMALDESVRSGRIRRGDLVLVSAMGAGITWGTLILRW